MHNTTTGADIFDALTEIVKKYKLPLDKLVCLATEGAPTMTGITKGVVARLKETCKQHGSKNFEHFNYIIHQQVGIPPRLGLFNILYIAYRYSTVNS
ncbi:general transcription factor II-I repeat domain-containing protein 2 [Trichonephila clavipes]|nr:general transcription factor II-I repeat domain-containing protein 2 [Trichonephila clavipes]